MQQLTVVGVSVMCGVAWGPARAHHDIGSDYSPDGYVRIEAVVEEFRFINPHAYVTAAVTAADGTTEQWHLLLDDRWELIEDGFTRSTLQPGDELIVTGVLSRRQSRNLYVISIERRADGFLYVEDAGEQTGE